MLPKFLIKWLFIQLIAINIKLRLNVCVNKHSGKIVLSQDPYRLWTIWTATTEPDVKYVTVSAIKKARSAWSNLSCSWWIIAPMQSCRFSKWNVEQAEKNSQDMLVQIESHTIMRLPNRKDSAISSHAKIVVVGQGGGAKKDEKTAKK